MTKQEALEQATARVREAKEAWSANMLEGDERRRINEERIERRLGDAEHELVDLCLQIFAPSAASAKERSVTT